MKNLLVEVLLLVSLRCFEGCTILAQGVSIEVPKGHIGWVYIIPTNKKDVISPKKGGKYIIDQYSIAHLPANELDIKKDTRLKIFSNGDDITDQCQYLGRVHKEDFFGAKYDFYECFIPSIEQQGKGQEYWIDKSYQFDQQNKFDSLVSAGLIKF